MNRCPLAALLIGLMLIPAASPADQDDPRLDDLFARLQAATEPAVVERISRRIWALWRQHEDARVAASMERGARALAAGEHARAESIYGEVIARDPGYAEGWNKRATARYLRGHFAAAAADIRRTLILEPRHFGALAGLGLVYMEIGREHAALAAFREALAINPHLPGARANVERLRRRLGDEAA